MLTYLGGRSVLDVTGVAPFRGGIFPHSLAHCLRLGVPGVGARQGRIALVVLEDGPGVSCPTQHETF